jgi:AcrR family transcriptional regulator
MALFFERGYDAVTIADIAERAGLTKRSFFNHFADKREVVFASADELQAAVLAALAEVDGHLEPLDTAVRAFTRAAAPIDGYPELARARRTLIASSPELQERDLAKMASMASSVADALARQGVPEWTATFAAHAATTIFTTAVDEWAANPEHGLATTIQDALQGFRAAITPHDQNTSPAGPPPA